MSVGPLSRFHHRTWWTSQRAAGVSHPFQTHPRSRAITALRCAGVCSRRVRPTSRGWLSADITIRVMSASHRHRASSDIGTGVPSSRVAGSTGDQPGATGRRDVPEGGPPPGGLVRGRAAARRSRRSRAARCAGGSRSPRDPVGAPSGNPASASTLRGRRRARGQVHLRGAGRGGGVRSAVPSPDEPVPVVPLVLVVPAQTRSASMTRASAQACPGVRVWSGC